MCTVTWVHEQAGGYHLFSSRDEKRTRSVALTPELYETSGVRWMAPLDPDGGGSWVAVNEFGFSVCLLNGNGTPGTLSRGRLVTELTWGKLQLARSFSSAELCNYSPFTLLTLEPGAHGTILEWNGRELKRQPALPHAQPLSSSSAAETAARQARAQLFQALRPRSVADFIDFHASHLPEPGPLSPCMHRPDASTVSFTHIYVAPGFAQLNYYPGPLCTHPVPLTVHLYARDHFDSLVHAGE